MSKNEYFDKPSGPPPNYGNQNQSKSSNYVPQAQPNYSLQTQDRGMFHSNQPQQGYYQQHPPQQGYYQQGPPQGQYYQQPQYQQQPMYVQQQPRNDGNETCLMACLAALCVCCTLDMLF
ncbi:hypothetical protein Cantr_01623 [Candida viswanathii]|uniref:Cysteine-rich transmembrane domain-containing protein n=1 Tax=Candida viswanathii TaxID=5486 RepID=A0A367YLC1_9ASCO|nr:hypothetical protein Cantr_01623 [Candida viswanathii]